MYKNNKIQVQKNKKSIRLIAESCNRVQTMFKELGYEL